MRQDAGQSGTSRAITLQGMVDITAMAARMIAPGKLATTMLRVILGEFSAHMLEAFHVLFRHRRNRFYRP